MTNLTIAELRKQFRETFAEYYYSEGCGCCSDDEIHQSQKEKICKLLNIKDGDILKYRKKK
jgi:hypothetical protein